MIIKKLIRGDRKNLEIVHQAVLFTTGFFYYR